MSRRTALAMLCIVCFSTAAHAVEVEYTLDPARSSFLCEGYFGGITTAWDTPGNRTAYSGTLRADRTPDGIRLLGGSLIEAALQPADVAPAPGGLPGAAPADYAFIPLDPSAQGNAALRNIVFDMSSDFRPTTFFSHWGDHGQYVFDALSIQFTMKSGSMDFLTPDSHGSYDFTGQSFGNGNDGYGSLDITNNIETFDLTISISYGNNGGLWVHFMGDLVATRTIPEPATLPLLCLAALPLLRRGRHNGFRFSVPFGSSHGSLPRPHL